MSRTVTVHATVHDLVGDETYEAWLKHESDAWTLVDADTVTATDGLETFTLSGLIDGADYSLQLRMKRAGRYRIGYLSADPETWPSASRIDFTVGALLDVAAPTLTAVDDWVRTDAVTSKFTVHITPDNTAKDLQLFRNGVVVHTFVQPLDASIVYDDVNPPLGTAHEYKARHIAGSLGGPYSASITKFAGPPVGSGLAQTSATDLYGRYILGWTNDGRTYRVEDDYLCASEFAFIGNDSDGTRLIMKSGNSIPNGDTQRQVTFQARIRAEVTTFGVTDVSDWITTNIEISDDLPEDGSTYETCP